MSTHELDEGVLSRARGTLLGQAIGDALGTTVEFQDAERIAERYPNGLRDLVGGGPFGLLPGQITDDTELALALARSLVEKQGYDDDKVAIAYSRWYRSGPFDMGITTQAAFAPPLPTSGGAADEMRVRAIKSSQANGSLMRQSPLGIFGWRLAPGALAGLACRDSTLSHPHAACQESCVAFTHAIAFAIRTGSGPADVFEETTAFMGGRPGAKQSGVLDAMVNARKHMPKDFHHHMGWVLIALQNAFFRLLHSPNIEEVLVQTVAQGGDTDTNACIAGALAGAVWGDTQFPTRWTDMLLGCKSPRPPIYSCHDLPEVSEALIKAGANAGP